MLSRACHALDCTNYSKCKLSASCLLSVSHHASCHRATERTIRIKCSHACFMLLAIFFMHPAPQTTPCFCRCERHGMQNVKYEFQMHGPKQLCKWQEAHPVAAPFVKPQGHTNTQNRSGPTPLKHTWLRTNANKDGTVREKQGKAHRYMNGEKHQSRGSQTDGQIDRQIDG